MQQTETGLLITRRTVEKKDSTIGSVSLTVDQVKEIARA